MACTIDVAVNGEALDSAGLPTQLVVYGHITSGTCTRVRCRVRLFQGAPVLFSADVATDSNGTWICTFELTVAPLACGTPLWIEAQCISGGSCAVAQTVHVACKQTPGGGGGNNQPQPPGSGNHGNNWPWPWPPAIFCPAIGRMFTQTLLLAVLALLLGVMMLDTTLIVGALTAIGTVFVVFFGIWTWFCQPRVCYVLGAMLWVAKRGTIAAIVLLVMSPNFAMLIALWIIGAIAGILTGLMRKRRCSIPRLSTSINQLPVW